MENKEKGHIEILDGWRGIAILAVLAAHMFPIGPKSLKLNECVGIIGMAVFFALSGFLITVTLIERGNVIEFLIRRFTRIIPLSWLYTIIVLVYISANAKQFIATLLFFANLPPFWLTNVTGHMWSLCVEMQFYIFIAILFMLLNKRGLKLLIPICIMITMLRVATGSSVSIVTYYRVDEILVGAILALIYKKQLGEKIEKFFNYINVNLMIILLIISCHADFQIMNYLRPYIAMLLIGATLYKKNTWVHSILKNNFLNYIAKISYALYIIHPFLMTTWLGNGEKIITYLKRPLLLIVLVILAHISSFYYEKYWIEIGKKIAKKMTRKSNYKFIGEENG